jgi:hypothetical protein
LSQTEILMERRNWKIASDSSASEYSSSCSSLLAWFERLVPFIWVNRSRIRNQARRSSGEVIHNLASLTLQSCAALWAQIDE